MSQQSSSPTLHPVLQAALKSLDLELEVELVQYRCHRAVRSFSPPVPQAKPDKTSASALGKLAITSKPLELAELGFNRTGSDRNTAHLAAIKEEQSLTELTRHRLNPDGYLESSEALMKNLQQQKTFRQSKPARTLLTTGGILAIVLLLSSVGSGYLLLETPQLLDSSKPSDSPSPTTASPTPVATRSPDLAANPTAISPDLSAEEFVKLDLTSLSQVKSPPDKVQSSSPIRPINPGSGSQTTTAPTQSISSPHPLSQQKQSPRPSGKTTKATEVASSQGDGYWYVLVNYTGNSVLQQVQKIVKDAYVRDLPEGKRIQVGAFNDRQPAQELVQALKRAGIAATIRQP